jgi:hypothetical protein
MVAEASSEVATALLRTQQLELSHATDPSTPLPLSPKCLIRAQGSHRGQRMHSAGSRRRTDRVGAPALMEDPHDALFVEGVHPRLATAARARLGPMPNF